MHIGLPDGEPFAFAGPWEFWKAHKDREPLRTFTIITTAANERVKGIHDRMPVILTPDAEDEWLDPASTDTCELLDLLRPYPGELVEYPVSTQMNT